MLAYDKISWKLYVVLQEYKLAKQKGFSLGLQDTIGHCKMTNQSECLSYLIYFLRIFP